LISSRSAFWLSSAFLCSARTASSSWSRCLTSSRVGFCADAAPIGSASAHAATMANSFRGPAEWQMALVI